MVIVGFGNDLPAIAKTCRSDETDRADIPSPQSEMGTNFCVHCSTLDTKSPGAYR